MTPLPPRHLRVQRTDFLPFLSGLARLGGKSSKDEVVIGFSGGELWARAGGMESSVPAMGTWDGEVVIAHAALKAIAKAPFAVDPVLLAIEGDRFRIAGMSVPCRWNESDRAVVSIPRNADLSELLLADLVYDEATLNASGLLKRVQDARLERDKLLDKTVKLLAPLRLTRDDLARLVHQRLLERL